MKKFFIISVVLLIFVLLSWAMYALFFASGGDSVHTDEDSIANVNTGFDAAPPAREQKVTNITSERVKSYALQGKGDVLRIWLETGAVIDLTTRGTNRQDVKNLRIPDVKAAVWDEGGDRVIVRSQDKSYLYTFATEELRGLKSGLDYVAWADLPGRILYKYFDEGTGVRSLNIADANGSNWQELVRLPYRRASFVQIPDSPRIAFWESGDAFKQTALQTVSAINPSAPATILTGHYGADYLFAPNGQSLLMASTLDRGSNRMTVGVMNIQGGDYRNLNIPTLASKVVWSQDGKTIYYALPTDVPPGSVMPNDYKAGRFTTRDTLHKMDVTTGKSERIIELSDLTEKIDATNLILSPNEDVLFFINRVNGLLYRMNV